MAKCKDHLGNEYESQKEMCEKYKINVTTYVGRLKRGNTLEQAITLPLRKGRGKTIKDHLGNEYESVEKMCDHYGTKKNSYYARLQRGLTLETALIGVEKEMVKDHLGNEYETVEKMCNHYGTKKKSYYKRLQRGWTLEGALLGKYILKDNFANSNDNGRVVLKKCKNGKYRDHIGKKFESKAAMAKAYGLTYDALEFRLAGGMDLDTALTKDVQKSYKSHLGEENITTSGQKMKIIECRSFYDMDVQFEDGYIRKHVSCAVFTRGRLSNPSLDTGYKNIKVAYVLSDGSVYMYCKCRKCGKEYIGTWRDVYAHEC